jgi:hypothetical protein
MDMNNRKSETRSEQKLFDLHIEVSDLGLVFLPILTGRKSTINSPSRSEICGRRLNLQSGNQYDGPCVSLRLLSHWSLPPTLLGLSSFDASRHAESS